MGDGVSSRPKRASVTESAKRLASFCVATGMSPSEYRALTLAEYRAFVEALEERSGT